ncbi:MAG: hypothetical protein JXL81_07400, partial [Deltaproteobacteria bacterium]|nr:hypothetical protein [Deltaproteobacteria bacterium]
MKKEDISNSMDNLSRLESLYQNNPNEFTETFPLVFEENQDSIVLKVWKERLFYESPQADIKKPDRVQLKITILLAIITGILVEIPRIIPIVAEQWFYPRYPVILTLTALTFYFLKRYQRSKQSQTFIGISIAFLFLLAGIFLFPDRSDTFILSCIHFPLVAWSLLGIAFTGNNWNSTEKRIDFLRFNGDLIIYTAIILLTGIVMTFVTFGLFQLIDLNIEKWYMENIVVMGLVAAPVVATYIIDSSVGIKKNIASMIARIFMPLFLVTVVAYLVAMVIQQKSPYSDRDFLIVFNALLLLVLAISVFSIIEKKYQEGSKILGVTNIALVVTTLIID